MLKSYKKDKVERVYDYLLERGCINQSSHTDELRAELHSGKQMVFYCGFDPTADSLHAGSLFPIIMMKRFQEAGHKPLVLVGTGTGMIGDPSFRSEERNFLGEEKLNYNSEKIAEQLSRFFETTGAAAFKMVKNYDWLKELSMIDFLRDVGIYFSVNSMIAKESVKDRLENRDQGISYTEFTYMLLQAYDFYYLNKVENCRLQIGGSDQWGNMTAGTDLIRRKNSSEHPQAYVLTNNLLVSSSGKKFGKSQEGAIWLDASKTSPYQFFQYWYNLPDDDASKLIRYLTTISEGEILELEKNPEKREVQWALAQEMTEFVHGSEETIKAINASKVLFTGDISSVQPKDLLEIFSHVPSLEVDRGLLVSEGYKLQDLLVKVGATDSKGSAKRLIEGGGLYINGEKSTDPAKVIQADQLLEDSFLIIRSGKKNYYLVKAV